MEEMERGFKGIGIDREIWLSEELSLMEKVLFAEIHSLDNERGWFASNGYFAQFFEMSARQISSHISSLKAKGYITITIENHHERTIRVTGKYAYANPESMRRLKRHVKNLGGRFSVDKRQGGRKETSWGVGSNPLAPTKKTSRIIIQYSNRVNKKKTLKEGKGLWITPIEDELFCVLVVWLMSQSEGREALLTPEPPVLPVIAY